MSELPTGAEWQYEPKWDGFRCLAFRDDTDAIDASGDTGDPDDGAEGGSSSPVELRSKSGQSLTRYFPEVAAALGALRASRFVLDGEIVVPTDQGLSFDALLQRIHPARSRVERLARETPAVFIAFDMLVDGRGNDLTARPLAQRRERLERFAASQRIDRVGIMLSPATRDVDEARAWLAEQAGTDGVMAKRADRPYASGERTAMEKIKRKRTADCVVGGFRYASKGKVVGSLLLGLYDGDGILHHVGFTSSLSANERKRVTPVLERLRGGSGFTGRAPGGPSRWSTARSGEWEALEPRLVVEVEYDHFTNGRFRHGTKFLRWRPDKAPAQCKLSQVAEARHEAARSKKPEGARQPPTAGRRPRAARTARARNRAVAAATASASTAATSRRRKS